MAIRKTRTRTRKATTRRAAGRSAFPRRATTRRATTRRAVSRPTTRRSANAKSPRRGANGGNVWTRQDIAFLRKHYRTQPTAWVARQLGRTVYSVRYKASDLNVKKAKPSVWRANSPKNAPKPANRRSGVRRSTTRARFASPKKRSMGRRNAPRRRSR